jgi:RNA polymerase sigma-70 factor, ECF subfamily
MGPRGGRPEPDAPGSLGPYAGWDDLYEDNVVRVYRLMYSRVGNRADAEDLTSEVFMAALRPLRTDAPRPQVRSYLAATARTVLARHWRRHYSVPVTHIDDTTAVAMLEEPPSDGEAEAHVQAVLSALPDRYRAVLELRFLRRMSVKEAARALGVTVSNAKVLQHRALLAAAKGGPGIVPCPL